jgi:hypothetical protein
MVQSYTLIGKYTYSDYQKLIPKDSNSQQIKYLLIKQSKYQGRPPYLCAIIVGDAKPQFISSCYEPRTPSGLFHFEYQGLRYEIIRKAGDEVAICHYQQGGLK